jgi:hypothetical protein
MNFPEIKKKISSFMAEEEGNISKKSLAKIGGFVGGITLANILFSSFSEAQANGNCPGTQTHENDNFWTIETQGEHAHFGGCHYINNPTESIEGEFGARHIHSLTFIKPIEGVAPAGPHDPTALGIGGHTNVCKCTPSTTSTTVATTASTTAGDDSGSTTSTTAGDDDDDDA